MVSKMTAARLHPALSQCLGGVINVVSVKFWSGRRRRRLLSPGCGCGSGSGGFLFVVLSYVLTLSYVAHAATPLVTVNAARNPSEQWRTFSGNGGYEVAGQGSNIKNPTDVVNVCAGQQFYIGGGLIPESGATQSTIFRVLYWRDEQVKYALAALSTTRVKNEDDWYPFTKYTVPYTEDTKNCQGKIRTQVYCMEEARGQEGARFGSRCSATQRLRVISPMSTNPSTVDTSSGLILFDDTVTDTQGRNGWFFLNDALAASYAHNTRYAQVATELGDIDNIAGRPYVIFPPVRKSSNLLSHLGIRRIANLRSYTQGGGRLIFHMDRLLAALDVVNAICGTSMKRLPHAKLRNKYGQLVDVFETNSYFIDERNAVGRQTPHTQELTATKYSTTIDRDSMPLGASCAYGLYQGCTVVVLRLGAGTITLSGLTYQTRGTDESRGEWFRIIQYGMQWTPRDAISEPQAIATPPTVSPPEPIGGCAAANPVLDIVILNQRTLKAPLKALRNLRAALPDFAKRMTAAGISVRFAFISYGWAWFDVPQVEIDFTSAGDNDAAVRELVTKMENVMTLCVSPASPRPYPSPALEAMRKAVANGAGPNQLMKDEYGLQKLLSPRREGARPAVILFAGDASSTACERSAGGTCTYPSSSGETASEVQRTADALIGAGALLSMVVNPDAGISSQQFGNPSASKQANPEDSDEVQYSREERANTLAALDQSNAGSSLEATLLRTGLPVRTYHASQFGHSDARDMLDGIFRDSRLHPPACAVQTLSATRRQFSLISHVLNMTFGSDDDTAAADDEHELTFDPNGYPPADDVNAPANDPKAAAKESGCEIVQFDEDSQLRVAEFDENHTFSILTKMAKSASAAAWPTWGSTMTTMTTMTSAVPTDSSSKDVDLTWSGQNLGIMFVVALVTGIIVSISNVVMFRVYLMQQRELAYATDKGATANLPPMQSPIKEAITEQGQGSLRSFSVKMDGV